MLIVLDGIDGSGKTTQTQLLIKRLKKEKYKVASFNFPNYHNNFFGKMTKQYLHGEFGKVQKINPYLSSILYAADRWESKTKIQKKLNNGYIVILNRYVSSNKIHQASKINPSQQSKYLTWLDKMEYKIFQIPKPTLVLFLYLPVNIVCDLIHKRGRKKDEHEKDTRHLKNALKTAEKLAKKYKNWHKINCTKNNQLLTKQNIATKIYLTIKPFLEVSTN